MYDIQAAIFDVDGTLFDYHDKKIHDSTVQAIKRLKARGTRILIASGRSFPLLGDECLSKIPADFYISANGHSILDSHRREIFTSRFTFEQTELVVRLARQYKCGLLLKYNDFSYLYSNPDEMFQVFNNMGLSQDAFRLCPSMDHHYEELPVGFTIRGGHEIKESLSAHVNDYRVELFHDITECDVFSPRINKMTALSRLADILGLDRTRCIAFGDSRNDIEMIRWAGIGIAMGNACTDLKEAADLICGNSWEDGIAQAVEQFL